ncbi:MAG: type II toxin-antitoxin system RelE family toxin [Promethearchaeota archaeon]
MQWTNKARNQIKKLPLVISKRIFRAIDDLVENPDTKDVRKLKGTPFYRLRVGDFRVIFEIQKNELIILILSLGNRKNIYK